MCPRAGLTLMGTKGVQQGQERQSMTSQRAALAYTGPSHLALRQGLTFLLLCSGLQAIWPTNFEDGFLTPPPTSP